MEYTFKNTILLIVFNYSNCVLNKNYLLELYGKYFRQIIFYSDLPQNGTDPEINYMDIHKGYFTHRIFKHFYLKYAALIEDSDGLFYTMDDNIINLNILNTYSNKNLIYYYRPICPIDTFEGWWWTDIEGGKFGSIAIRNLLRDPSIAKFNIDNFCGAFSDWFYLPKKYLNDDLFDLFEIFAKYYVFLEIAIASIINNIEKDFEQFQVFSSEILWGNDRNKFSDKNYIYHSLNTHHNLLIHPLKFNLNGSYKSWLKEFFCKDKCIIITTINKPTTTILKHINNASYDLVIVGDNKTPDDYKSLNCIYLDIGSQSKLFKDLSTLVPSNHYCRKNIGYLYAIKRGYNLIYETDDDNVPYDDFDLVLNHNNDEMITNINNKWINIFKYFTNDAHIWPRGYPLSLVQTIPSYLIESTNKKPSIINALVENDPDVDALYRLICKDQDKIQWETSKKILVSNQNICVFNTQNTFWLNPSLFISMLIPSTVSFRYCDILRGLIANIVLNKTDNYMMYTSPNVIQYRNEHNLISDFKSEYEMYIHNENILEFIDKDIIKGADIKVIMEGIYSNLLENNVIKQLDIDILNKWFEYF